MKNTKIAWCDHTFNPWIGCRPVSEGCRNCYAAAQNKYRKWCVNADGEPDFTQRRRTSAAYWRQPLLWNRRAASSLLAWEEGLKLAGGDEQKLLAKGFIKPRRPRVFCGSLCDWLDDEAPIGYLADLLALIMATPNLDWLLLTKRPENWVWRLREIQNKYTLKNEVWDFAVGWLIGEQIPHNVRVGLTVENQHAADYRIPDWLAIPAKVRFLSCEPLLGEVDLHYPVFNGSDSFSGLPGIHWVICGGESGPKSRPMLTEWARLLHRQCFDAEVPFFMKQMGGRNGKMPPIPSDLNVREFPKVEG